MHQKHAYFLQKGNLEEELLPYSPHDQMEVEKLTDIFYTLQCLDWCMIILGLILTCIIGSMLAVFSFLLTASAKVDACISSIVMFMCTVSCRHF